MHHLVRIPVFTNQFNKRTVISMTVAQPSRIQNERSIRNTQPANFNHLVHTWLHGELKFERALLTLKMYKCIMSLTIISLLVHSLSYSSVRLWSYCLTNDCQISVRLPHSSINPLQNNRPVIIWQLARVNYLTPKGRRKSTEGYRVAYLAYVFDWHCTSDALNLFT